MEQVKYYSGQDPLPNEWTFPEKNWKSFRLLGVNTGARYVAFSVDEPDHYDYFDFQPLIERLLDQHSRPIFERIITDLSSKAESIEIYTYMGISDIGVNYFKGEGTHIDFNATRRRKAPNQVASILYDGRVLESVIFMEAFKEKIKAPNLTSPRIVVDLDYGVETPQSVNDFKVDMIHSNGDPHTYYIMDTSFKNNIGKADIVSETGRCHSHLSWEIRQEEITEGVSVPYLVVQQRHRRTGIIKQIRARLFIDDKGLYERANAATTKNPDSGQLEVPWADSIKALGVNLSYQNSR